MEREIELKLLVSANAGEILNSYLESNFPHRYTASEANLYNQYFDTPDKQLRRMDIGLRVRGKDNQFEQTLKTQGSVVGGLHSRPEYNVPLDDDKVNLSLFPDSAWPDDANVERLQSEIQPLFTTHFKRISFEVTCSNDSQIEVVFDSGLVEANGHKEPICEVELELKQGSVADLCDFARGLAEVLPFRLGSRSKAARGYALAAQSYAEPNNELIVLPLTDKDSNEQAFINALTFGFDYWQQHQSAYCDSNKIRYLGCMYRGMRLTLQALVLFMPNIECPEVLKLHQKLTELVDEWSWVEGLSRIKQFRSKKGLFRKLIDKSPAFLSYLQGRSEGLLIQNAPIKNITDKNYSQACLDIVQLLSEKPWRKHNDSWEHSIADTAKSRLTQSWHNIVQIMPYKKSMTAEQYVACEVVLRQTQFNGLFIAGLYNSPERDQFRSHWIDLLSGIEELNTLSFLFDEVAGAYQSEEKEESRAEFESLQGWCQDKIQHLLAVMEQSRKHVVKIEPYW